MKQKDKIKVAAKERNPDGCTGMDAKEKIYFKKKVKLSIVRISTFPKLIYRFHKIIVKISAKFVVHIDKFTLKFAWKGRGYRLAETI